MDETDTELKLRDAAAQIKLALSLTADEETLRSCINSFISHARSVTFVMQKESSGSPTLLKWYEETMEQLKNIPIMKFFHAKRLHSIHKGVVKPQKISTAIWNLKINGELQLGTGEMTVWIFDGVKEYIPNDSGNMFRLCEEYFLALKWLVSVWLKKRHEPGLEESV